MISDVRGSFEIKTEPINIVVEANSNISLASESRLDSNQQRDEQIDRNLTDERIARNVAYDHDKVL